MVRTLTKFTMRMKSMIMTKKVMKKSTLVSSVKWDLDTLTYLPVLILNMGMKHPPLLHMTGKLGNSQGRYNLEWPDGVPRIKCHQ